jgi:hypothetical protein
MRLGEPSACHPNAAMMFVRSRRRVRIASGYALSADGLWRQHSWGVDVEDGRIIETTERRLRYYGIVLNDVETAWRLLTVKESGALRPDEAEEVREVLLKVFRLPAELVDPVDPKKTGRTGRGRP